MSGLYDLLFKSGDIANLAFSMTKKTQKPDVLEDLKNREDKKARRKELKKLVVYAEIMKPKYEEGLK